MCSPIHLSQQDSAKALFFGMRRERTAISSGPCFLINDVEPTGWNETRNDNFLCTGAFSPTDSRKFLESLNDAKEQIHDSLDICNFFKQFKLEDDHSSSSDEYTSSSDEYPIRKLSI